MINDKKTYNGPRRLPVLALPKHSYYIDLVLGQFRDVENAYIFIDFDSEEGGLMCDTGNIVTCPACGTHMIVTSRIRATGFHCVQCLRRIPPME